MFKNIYLIILILLVLIFTILLLFLLSKPSKEVEKENVCIKQEVVASTKFVDNGNQCAIQIPSDKPMCTSVPVTTDLAPSCYTHNLKKYTSTLEVYEMQSNNAPMTYYQFLLLIQNENFVTYFNKILNDFTERFSRWMIKFNKCTSLDDKVIFLLQQNKSVGVSGSEIDVFNNPPLSLKYNCEKGFNPVLGRYKDKAMIIPCKNGSNDYTWLGSFLKNAPLVEILTLWKNVSVLFMDLIKENRICYLNTHGTGVKWLHVRIDHSPRYYSNLPHEVKEKLLK